MSLTGRRTCVSASTLNLDAQPAHVESVVKRISRPDWGMGMRLLKNNGKVESSFTFYFPESTRLQIYR